jgi:glycosyltransferase involved in cell wall biosynthesis
VSGSSTAPRPLRILHVVSSLERGGIELWLMQVLQTIDRERYRMDFLVLGERTGVLEQQLRSLGSQVLICRSYRRLWQLRREFADVLASYGPYDVVHSHVHHFSGLIARMAAWHGVAIRVVHSHNDTRPAETGASWRRRLYLLAMKRWIRRYATQRVAASRLAAEDLFGPDWAADPRCEILFYGLDFSVFAGQNRRGETRQALDLPGDALVIGHVGRFHRRKNHEFVLDIAAEIFARKERARLLLVGDGELMPAIESRAQQLGIADRVVFTGARADIPALMQAMDVFVFPSHHEGLGLVLLEAQASGLPCMLAEAIPEEVDVVPSLIHRLPLTVSAEIWASAVLEAVEAPRETADRTWQAVCQSDFSLERSAANVLRVYQQAS